MRGLWRLQSDAHHWTADSLLLVVVALVAAVAVAVAVAVSTAGVVAMAVAVRFGGGRLVFGDDVSWSGI